MRAAALTVGTSAVAVPYTDIPKLGMKIIAREANAGNVFMGFTSGVTISTGTLVPKGEPGVTLPEVVPPEHFNPGPGTVYLIASEANQVVDWKAQ